MHEVDLSKIEDTAEYYRWRGCESKVTHRLRKQAKKHAENLNRLPDNRGKTKLKAYKCQWCEFYHVGHYKAPAKVKTVRAKVYR